MTPRQLELKRAAQYIQNYRFNCAKDALAEGRFLTGLKSLNIVFEGLGYMNPSRYQQFEIQERKKGYVLCIQYPPEKYEGAVSEWDISKEDVASLLAHLKQKEQIAESKQDNGALTAGKAGYTNAYLLAESGAKKTESALHFFKPFFKTNAFMLAEANALMMRIKLK